MKWEMEIEQVQAILEKIWDIHDKLSDAIHSISRAHFLNSIKTVRKSEKTKGCNGGGVDDARANGYVYVKDFGMKENDDEFSMIQEAKSLNAIRSALENLEEQLDFFHTVQTQQQVERDAAIAQLEQSRIVLAMRLAEHHGKKSTVIEEALAFVGDVHDAGRFVSPENLYGPSGDNLVTQEKRSNMLIKAVISSFDFAKNFLGLDNMGGILGNAALFAVSMIGFLQLHQVDKEHPQKHANNVYCNRNVRNIYRLEESSFSRSSHLDVSLARG